MSFAIKKRILLVIVVFWCSGLVYLFLCRYRSQLEFLALEKCMFGSRLYWPCGYGKAGIFFVIVLLPGMGMAESSGVDMITDIFQFVGLLWLQHPRKQKRDRRMNKVKVSKR